MVPRLRRVTQTTLPATTARHPSCCCSCRGCKADPSSCRNDSGSCRSSPVVAYHQQQLLKRMQDARSTSLDAVEASLCQGIALAVLMTNGHTMVVFTSCRTRMLTMQAPAKTTSDKRMELVADSATPRCFKLLQLFSATVQSN